MAQAEFNLGMLELRNNNVPDAVTRFNAASRLFRRLADETAIDASLWKSLVVSLIHEADATASLPGDRSLETESESVELIQEALHNLRALLALHNQQVEFCTSLVSLYQQGIESLLRLQRLPIVDDELNHLQKLIVELNATSPKGGRESARESMRRINMISRRQHALLAAGLQRPDAMQRVQAAINAYQANAQLVASDSFLRRDLALLQRLAQDLQ